MHRDRHYVEMQKCPDGPYMEDASRGDVPDLVYFSGIDAEIQDCCELMH